MTKRRCFHQDVVKYFIDKYGANDKNDCVLKSLYPEDWDNRWGVKERGLKFDYLLTSGKQRAIVEVIGVEQYQETLGKVIVYLNEVKEFYNGTRELWLVFYSAAHWQEEERSCSKMGTREKHKQYSKDWFKLLKNISLNVVSPELGDKLKFFDYEVENGEGQLRIL